MSIQSDQLQIGEFARLAGTNLRTLRYYEELGLIQPVTRSEGGFRYYAPQQVDRVLAIKRLQQLGLSLKEIRGYMVDETNGTDSEHLDRIALALQRQEDLLQERIREMQADLDDIRGAAEKLDACRRCEKPLTLADCDPCVRDETPLPPVLRALL